MYTCNDVFDMTFSHELATRTNLQYLPQKHQVCGKEWMNRNGTNDFETKVIFAWFSVMGVLVWHWQFLLSVSFVAASVFWRRNACKQRFASGGAQEASQTSNCAQPESQTNTESFSKKTITNATRTTRASSDLSTGSRRWNEPWRHVVDRPGVRRRRPSLVRERTSRKNAGTYPERTHQAPRVPTVPTATAAAYPALEDEMKNTSCLQDLPASSACPVQRVCETHSFTFP